MLVFYLSTQIITPPEAETHSTVKKGLIHTHWNATPQNKKKIANRPTMRN
jgi:hypothetical protein